MRTFEKVKIWHFHAFKQNWPTFSEEGILTNIKRSSIQINNELDLYLNFIYFIWNHPERLTSIFKFHQYFILNRFTIIQKVQIFFFIWTSNQSSLRQNWLFYFKYMFLLTFFWPLFNIFPRYLTHNDIFQISTIND